MIISMLGLYANGSSGGVACSHARSCQLTLGKSAFV